MLKIQVKQVVTEVEHVEQGDVQIVHVVAFVLKYPEEQAVQLLYAVQVKQFDINAEQVLQLAPELFG